LGGGYFSSDFRQDLRGFCVVQDVGDQQSVTVTDEVSAPEVWAIGTGKRTRTMDNLQSTTPGRLARLLRLDEDEAEVGEWQRKELGAILRHQLDSPLTADLAVEKGMSGSIRTFGELLGHPDPPVRLLELLKDFAKAHCSHPRSSYPTEVMKAIYYASIEAALLRAGQRITRLSDEELSRGLAMLVDRPWLEERTRGLLMQGLSCLRAAPGG